MAPVSGPQSTIAYSTAFTGGTRQNQVPTTAAAVSAWQSCERSPIDTAAVSSYTGHLPAAACKSKCRFPKCRSPHRFQYPSKTRMTHRLTPGLSHHVDHGGRVKATLNKSPRVRAPRIGMPCKAQTFATPQGARVEDARAAGDLFSVALALCSALVGFRRVFRSAAAMPDLFPPSGRHLRPWPQRSTAPRRPDNP